MWLQIAHIVAPLGLIVFVGYLYNRHVHTDMRLPNQLNLHIFIPALLFYVLADQSLELREYRQFALGTALIVIGSGLLSWPLIRLMGLQQKTVLPPMMFNNSGNMGMPLGLLAFGEKGLAAATVMFLISNLLHLTLGARILGGRVSLLKLLGSPMMIASFAGIAVNLAGLSLPQPLMLSSKMLGDIAIPLMLFALGTRMTDINLSWLKISVISALLCSASGLLMALLSWWLLALDARDFAQLLVFSVLPPAVLNYMYAEKHHQEPEKVASIVLVGNLMSIIIIPLTLIVALGLFNSG